MKINGMMGADGGIVAGGIVTEFAENSITLPWSPKMRAQRER